jgi:hypothetical protein
MRKGSTPPLESLKLQSSESGHMSTFTVIFFVAGVSDCCDLSRMTSESQTGVTLQSDSRSLSRHFGHKSFVRPAHTGFS